MNGNWSFPSPVPSDLSSIVNDLPPIEQFQSDRIEWIPPGPSLVHAQESTGIHGTRVNWWSTVWFEGSAPRMDFLLWMVFKRKL